MSPNTQTPPLPSIRRCVVVTLLGWLAIVGFDFFQNAGVFAASWREPGSAFLPSEILFQRIPWPLGFIGATGAVRW